VAALAHANACPACTEFWNKGREENNKGKSPVRLIVEAVITRIVFKEELLALRKDPELSKRPPLEGEEKLLRATSMITCEEVRALKGSYNDEDFRGEEGEILQEEVRNHFNVCETCRGAFFERTGIGTPEERDLLNKNWDYFKSLAKLAEAHDRRYVAPRGVKTHHFYIATREFSPLMLTPKKEVMVYLDSKQAKRAFCKRFKIPKYLKNFVIVGMGDREWTLFRSENKHIVISRKRR
jgi:hypothetical protein